MTDADLYALCIWTEARGQPYEGQVAVARVIANRMAKGYFSDGTVSGTVLRYDQFSAFYFAMVNGRYTRIASDAAGAPAVAEELLTEALADHTWASCEQAVIDGQIGSNFAWGPQGRKINANPMTLLYCNPAISQPDWAIPAKEVAVIYDHTFYEA